MRKFFVDKSRNSELWSLWIPHTIERYQSSDLQSLLRQRRDAATSLEWAVGGLLDAAFTLLSGGEENLGRTVAQFAYEVAADSVKQESFEKLFAHPTETEREVEKARGMMKGFQSMHYARWLSDGIWDVDLLKQALPYHEKYFAHYDRPRYPTAVVDLMMEYAKAGLFQDVCRLAASDLTARPKQGTKLHNLGFEPLRALATHITTGQRTASEVEDLLAPVYGECQCWYKGLGDLAWWDRLNLAYLYGKYVSGITEQMQLLRELRGC